MSPQKVYKNYWGWNAESEIPLENNRVLNVHTMKRYSGNLVTVAQVMRKESGGGRSYVAYLDYNKSVVSERPKRISAKTVVDQHSKSLESVDSILNEVKSFYGEAV